MTTRPADLVRRFYDEVWNRADEAVAWEIPRPDFAFRGSLGPESMGVEAFLAYARHIHAALGDYGRTILTLVEEGEQAAARMRFAGVHRGPFFGVAPTGRDIAWQGAAFFTVDRGRLSLLWVLGDVAAIRVRLGLDEAGPPRLE
jgi:predicted ester cyclase